MLPAVSTALAMATLTTVVVLLRIFTQLKVRQQNLNAADYTTIAAVAECWISFSVTGPFAYSKLQQATLPPDSQDLPRVLQNVKLTQILFALSGVLPLCLSKISMLRFYLSLVSTSWYRTAIKANISFVGLYTTMYIAYYCVAWSRSQSTPRGLSDYYNDMAIASTYSWMNFAVDVVLLAIPIIIIAPLKMTTRKKVSILLLFIAGVLVCIMAFCRSLTISKGDSLFPPPSNMSKTDRSLRLLRIQIILGHLEINFSTICATLPLLWQLFAKWLPTRFHSLIDGTCAGFRGSLHRKRGMRKESARFDHLEEGDSSSIPPTFHGDSTVVRHNRERYALQGYGRFPAEQPDLGEDGQGVMSVKKVSEITVTSAPRDRHTSVDEESLMRASSALGI